MQFFVDQVLELWLIHFDELDEKWMNFNVNADSLGIDGEETNFIVNASQIPGVIWEISNLRLEISYWCKFSGCKLELPSSLI